MAGIFQYLVSFMDLFYISETCFKVAAAFYLVGTVLYLLYLALRRDLAGRVATYISVTALLFHTGGLAARWMEAGINHPPFTNLYESLLFFAWGIVLFYLVLEWRYKFKAGGAFIIPVAVGAMAAAVLNPESGKDIHALMPALQSYWLHAHVAVAALAYAGFVAAFGTSLMFIIKDGTPVRWLGFSSNLFMAFMLLISDRFNILIHRVFTLNQVRDGQVTDKLAGFPIPGIILLIAAVYFIIAAVLYLYRTEERPAKARTILGIPFGPFVTMLGTVFTLAALLLLVRAALTSDTVALFGNPFKIIILALVVFVGTASFIFDLKLSALREILPRPELLDSITYQTITVAFPLMTMVIITGMVWAKVAFGQYWQWDPKETASLITWIIYTGYLHAKVSLDWPPRRVAAIAILGFASVVFTYLGVNAIGTGYHSYAGF
ncbi:MAG: cytochrome c biogenesis protein CcsA [bacterium]